MHSLPQLSSKRQAGSDELSQPEGPVPGGCICSDPCVGEDAEQPTNSLSLLRATLETSADGIFATDRSGKVVCHNHRFAEMWSLPYEQVSGPNRQELAAQVAGQVRDPEPFLDRVRESQAHPEAEYFGVIELNDGRTFEHFVRPLKLGSLCAGSVIICRDVTERMRMEMALAHERDLLDTLLGNLPDNIYFKDRESRLVRVSRSKVEATLKTVRESHRATHPDEPPGLWHPHLESAGAFGAWLIGKTDFDTYPEAHARAAYEDEQEIIRTGQAMDDKLQKATLPDGKAIWWLSTKMPWRDRDGEIIGTFGISKDVTPLKEAEAELEITHRRLVEASRMAGKAEVATSVLHNVGNVLNSINVSVNVLTEQARNSLGAGLDRVIENLGKHREDLVKFLSHEDRSAQLVRYLKLLSEALTTRQAETLEELRQLAKGVDHVNDIIATQQDYARVFDIAEQVNVIELVEDALRMHSGALVRHDVQLVREYDPDIPPVTIQKHKVLQVLVNVIHNAKHACNETGRMEKQLTVRISSGEGRVRIAVQDNGVGIPPENLTRIFSHGFTTRKGGHGFGLHGAALAAHEIGGMLHAQSPGLGQGATFTLEIPVQDKSLSA